MIAEAVFSAALTCMAKNIFHEARGELIPGQYAVAQVTMNRAGGDPAKVCKVVYAKHQFSWTLSPKKREVHPKRINPHAWKTARIIARQVLKGKAYDITGGADHYHATYVRPKWRLAMKKTKRIGLHVFYASI